MSKSANIKLTVTASTLGLLPNVITPHNPLWRDILLSIPLTLFRGQFFFLFYIMIRAFVKIDIESVSEGALPHVKCYFKFYMVCKETTFVIYVYYMYIVITSRS